MFKISYIFILLFICFSPKLFSKNNLSFYKQSFQQSSQNFRNTYIDTPAIIPMPQKVEWLQPTVELKQLEGIFISNDSLFNLGEIIQKHLQDIGVQLPLIKKGSDKKKYLQLTITTKNEHTEGYEIEISKNSIKISSISLNGLFNGIQTFKQIAVQQIIPSGFIKDWPAYSWRAFMIDVGRNFQSLQQIKDQIDIMAAYKLNVFHLHLTEDIAWRLESKLYPALNYPSNMIRNKGSFYTFEELRDLIKYCKQKYITLVPEIDMPGHSAAFKRAMGVDMQSERGTEICKNILTELCTELNVPMVHIGGDEVVIANPSFLPQMTELLLSKNKKVIAWNPGGVLPEGTTLQMWNGKTKPKLNYPSIDSRHLYLNHFDPIDGVVAVFNHKICDTTAGNKYNLGATLCNWPDRKVSSEKDLISMNAVFPILLTFSERCWNGGGWENYASDIGVPGSQKYIAFQNFEDRLLIHKEKYFKNKSFPYFKQSQIEWRLVGPFENFGNTKKSFFVESINNLDALYKISKLKVYGGTIWLRHFWDPMIQSHIANQNDSNTYYAITKIWSNKTELRNFWMGFNNLSRSTATDSPPLNEWDERNSKIWLNNTIITPPIWSRAGEKGDSEIPIIDENYELRPPQKLLLKKGWNYVLIKSPVGSFKAKDWQNPVKWMFSFIPQ